MGNTQIKITAKTREELVQATHQALKQINLLLRKTTKSGGTTKKPHSIDEVAVLSWSTTGSGNDIEAQGAALVFSLSLDSDRKISQDDLSSAHISLLFGCRYENSEQVLIHEVQGQAGELFDFVVPIKYDEHEFFVFGNYLDGTMEDLEKNPYWKMAKNSFEHLAITLCSIITESNSDGHFDYHIRTYFVGSYFYTQWNLVFEFCSYRFGVNFISRFFEGLLFECLLAISI